MSFTDWLIKRKYPGCILIDPKGFLVIDIHEGSVRAGTLDIAVIEKILKHNKMGKHLTRSQGKGSRKAKKTLLQEQREAHETPEETLRN
jgi:hypothetical protein